MTPTERHRVYYFKHKDHIEAQRRNRPKQKLSSRFSRLLSNAKARSRREGWECDLDHNYLQELYENQNGICALSGLALEIGDDNSRTLSHQISLDRIDNSQGYIKGNVQLTCTKINYMRGLMSLDEFIEMCGLIVEKNRAL